jgi:hypothetical protein
MVGGQFINTERETTRCDFTEILQIGNTLLTKKGDNEGEHKRPKNKEV